MKKKLIAGLTLISAMAYGDIEAQPIKAQLGNNIEDNKIIIDNLKIENQNLSEQLENLKETLSDWKLGLIKHTDFTNEGVYISREKRTFSIKIESNDLSDKKYENLLSSLVEVIKYNTETKVEITGNEENLKFLEDYLKNSEIVEGQVSFIDPKNAAIDNDIVNNEQKNLVNQVVKGKNIEGEEITSTLITFTKAISDEEEDKTADIQ